MVRTSRPVRRQKRRARAANPMVTPPLGFKRSDKPLDGLGDDWPMFRHRTRPEFLQTLPHVHGTSGFFVARLLVA